MTLKEFPETASEHRTDKFKLMENQGTILIRRGQSFKVSSESVQQQKHKNLDDVEICFLLQ